MKAAFLFAGVVVVVAASAGCGDTAENPNTTVGVGGSGAGGAPMGGAGEGGLATGGGGEAGGAMGGAGGSPPGPNTSPGCIDGAGLAEGEHTFMLENLSRRFMVRLPNNYDPRQPWPLVLALHGNGGSIASWDSTNGGNTDIRSVLADKAVLIIAEAIDNQWRDYNMPASTWPARIESELLYFEEVISQAKNELCLNQDQIFSMGFSGGGSFSGVLGCRRPDIRAIVVGGSVIYFDEADCTHTPAAWIGIGQDDQAAGRTAYLEFFRDRAGCMASSQPTDPAPCVAYDGCDVGTPVHYCEYPGGHVWPAIGSAAMWSFFEQFVN